MSRGLRGRTSGSLWDKGMVLLVALLLGSVARLAAGQSVPDDGIPQAPGTAGAKVMNAAPPPGAGTGLPTAGTGVATEQAAPATAADGKPLTRADVQKLIDAALKAEEEKRKKAEEEKKKEEEDRKKADADRWFPVGSVLGMTPAWDNGVWFQTPNKDFIFHVGGALQVDLALYNAGQRVQFGPGGVGDALGDGVNLRRARLRAEGTMWEVVDFLMELEFMNGFVLPFTPVATPNNVPDLGPSGNVFQTPGPTDFHVTVKQMPWIGNIRAGFQKEPFSLEHLNSYRYLEFMERSLIFDAFVPNTFNNGFNPGIMAFNTLFDQRLTWWSGIFKATDTPAGFDFGPGGYQYAGRITGLPVWVNDGGSLVHLGVGVVAGGLPDDGEIRLRARASVRNGPFPLLAQLANTGILTADSQELLNFESAAVFGSFTFQGEYTANWLPNAARVGPTGDIGPGVGTYFAHGYYVEALYFLTGEQRTYNRQTATFNRVIPRSPFFWVPGQRGWCCGPGAWEVGARYTWLDLTNKGINGGVLNDITLGVNWYLNPNVKFQWNYEILTRGNTGGGNPTDTIQAFGTRLAVDF